MEKKIYMWTEKGQNFEKTNTINTIVFRSVQRTKKYISLNQKVKSEKKNKKKTIEVKTVR